MKKKGTSLVTAELFQASASASIYFAQSFVGLLLDPVELKPDFLLLFSASASLFLNHFLLCCLPSTSYFKHILLAVIVLS